MGVEEIGGVGFFSFVPCCLVDWYVVVCANEMVDRESIMSQIEKVADELRGQGACVRWFAGAESQIKRV